jgi:hypothetical protein
MTWGIQIFILGFVGIIVLGVKLAAECDYDSDKFEMLPYTLDPVRFSMVQTWLMLCRFCVVLGAVMIAAGV